MGAVPDHLLWNPKGESPKYKPTNKRVLIFKKNTMHKNIRIHKYKYKVCHFNRGTQTYRIICIIEKLFQHKVIKFWRGLLVVTLILTLRSGSRWSFKWEPHVFLLEAERAKKYYLDLEVNWMFFQGQSYF